MIKDEIKQILITESEAISNLAGNIDNRFEKAVQLILECKGKVVVTGVGKSGHVGKKMAATFASTGTPAFFVHSTEGVHGDLGMIEKDDVVILISNSGETQEVLNLIPTLKKLGVKSIAITSKNESTLSRNVDVQLNYQYEKEADALNLAPSTSSTLTLVLGDSIALTVSKLKNFTNNDFYLYHPGGSLGKKLSEE